MPQWNQSISQSVNLFIDLLLSIFTLTIVRHSEELSETLAIDIFKLEYLYMGPEKGRLHFLLKVLCCPITQMFVVT